MARDKGTGKATEKRVDRLDTPRELRTSFLPSTGFSQETFGVWSENFARFMGTAQFLIWMTLFVAGWVIFNVASPAKFDEYPFIFLTLMLSLQASYAAPLILLAQNRQADRDRVAIEQDRARDERNLADTEFLTREVASLRLAMRETATRDFVRSELRALLEELEERGHLSPREDEERGKEKGKGKKGKGKPEKVADASPDPTDLPRDL